MAGKGQQAGVDVDDVEAKETWERLQQDPGSVLIDVRTQAEWAFVGVPDLSSLSKKLVCVEWQHFPGGQINPSFASQLQSELAAEAAGKDAELFFICRSGHRSLHSAEAMAAVGYRACHNVAGGFEGPPDSAAHRGLVAGWKAAGLPWVQR
ncbi:MAG: rhodanese-like domain-containing protein [Methyloligellaceae bacterium]